MKTLLMLLLCAFPGISAALSPGVRTIPTKDKATAEITAALETLKHYGIEYTVGDQSVKWVAYIERQIATLPKSGSGMHSGQIFLTDWYPAEETLDVPGHVTIEGTFRAKHHPGSSAGLIANKDFPDDVVIQFHTSKPNVHYSNFGAGLRNLHIQSIGGVDGVHFQGAQQAAGIDNLYVRGFGAATGLELRGDTYIVRDVFVDSGAGGGLYKSKVASIGVHAPDRIAGLRWDNITAHNCEEAFKLGDVQILTADALETEHCKWPLVLGWQSAGVTISGGLFRHTSNLMRIDRGRWPNDFRMKLEGWSVTASSITHPKGEWKTGRSFDLVIEGDKKDLYMTDLKKLRNPAPEPPHTHEDDSDE